MKTVTTKQDFLEACRVLSFAVTPDALPLTLIPQGEHPVRGLGEGKISHRTVDSSMLLSEITGTAAGGIFVSAGLVTYRDTPAVSLSVTLTNKTKESISLRAAFSVDFEFCGSQPMLLADGKADPVPAHQPGEGRPPVIPAEQFILQTGENCLLVRTKAECSTFRTPCGAVLCAGLHDITLGKGESVALPEVFLLASAGNDRRHAEQLWKAWEQRHG